MKGFFQMVFFLELKFPLSMHLYFQILNLGRESLQLQQASFDLVKW